MPNELSYRYVTPDIDCCWDPEEQAWYLQRYSDNQISQYFNSFSEAVKTYYADNVEWSD